MTREEAEKIINDVNTCHRRIVDTSNCERPHACEGCELYIPEEMLEEALRVSKADKE